MSTVLQFAPRRVLLLALLIFGACDASPALAKKIDGDKLFDPDRVIEVRIELPTDQWKRLCNQGRDPAAALSGVSVENPYTYFKADVWIDDAKLESVGIRKKGFLGSADTRRPSLKIKFDEFKKQDPIKGLTRLTLNNNKQDQSQVSQFLCYELFRAAGNPAPRSSWAHVVVNGEDLGVFSHVESVKKPMLERNFSGKKGNLYEGTLADFYPSSLSNIDVKTNRTKNDLADITRLASLLAAEGELDMDELGSLIDLDAFYRHWALEGLLVFWDGYCSNQNNYYLYFDPKSNGRGVFIPWGADAVFSKGGPFRAFQRGGGNQEPIVIYAQGILPSRLYKSEGGAEQYRVTMRQLLDSVWNEDNLLSEVDRIETLLEPHLNASQSGTSKAMDEVREFIRNRRAVVEKALDDWNPTVPPEPRKPAYAVEVGKVAGTFSTEFSQSRRDDAANSQTELSIELNGEPLDFQKLSVRVSPSAARRFPGFGRRGGGNAQDAPPPPISLVFTADRGDEEPIILSLTVDREKFVAAAAAGKPLKVTGSYQEGRRGGFGFGFGGGGGPRRAIAGELQLTAAGVQSGDAIAGSLKLQIVETHGGFFQQR